MSDGGSDHAKFLGFVEEQGFDLELAAAAIMKQAGFRIGQSVGVPTWMTAPTPAEAPRMVPVGGFSDRVRGDARELDVLAMHAANGVIFAFALECKSFRRCHVGILALEHDDLVAPATEFIVRGTRAHFPTGDRRRLELPVETRGFKLVSKPGDGSREQKDSTGYNPTWNAIRQVLDYAYDAAELPIFSEHKTVVVVPLLVVDAPLVAVRLVDGKATANSIGTASVRIAAHRDRLHQELYVVTRGALRQFAEQSLDVIKPYLTGLEPLH